MAGAGELPHTPYYGSVDSTPLWLILLGATFDWTGDRAMLDRLWPNALAALDWIDRYGDRDGDGFVEYERRSERGLLNQGWKDSGDAIRDRDGRRGRAADRPRRGPGLRLRREAPDGRASPAMRGDDRARRPGSMPTPRRSASRFEDAFWVEDQRYYAMALDARQAAGRRDRRRTPASACGPGSWRRTGPRDVADRLLQPGDVLRLGDPDLRRGPARLQPDRLPHRARSGRTTRR